MRFPSGRIPLPAVLLPVLFHAGCDGRTLPAGSRPPAIVVLELTRGTFPVRVYEPRPPVRAVVVFGSGDGGWKSWEDRAARALSLAGCRVIGWDCREYAKSPYAAGNLGEDLARMASRGCSGIRGALPVIYGGYSTGAEQAVAAAGWGAGNAAKSPSRGADPRALLLVAPGSRGRYGMTLSDLMGLTPRGEKSFALEDFCGMLASMPVVQIHGSLDPLDSTRWLRSSGQPGAGGGSRRLYVLKGSGHFFGDADAGLQEALVKGLDWILGKLNEAPVINPAARKTP